MTTPMTDDPIATHPAPAPAPAQNLSESREGTQRSQLDPLASLDLLERAEASLAAELGSPTASARNRAGLGMLSILMPVYNERWTVADVIRRVAATPLGIASEILVIDDGSKDGSAELVAGMMAEIPQLRLVRMPKNGGKGAAIRRGIEEMSGDVAVIQDADLEYDPADLPALLQPVLDDQADAVFGSRFAGSTRRCLPFWHAQINRVLTLASNMVTDTSLTDMETGYKVVRADVLRSLRLRSRSFTLEPEITCRLAQWGARIYESPISYRGRSFEEGKKIRSRDGIKALLTLLRCRIVDSEFSDQPDDSMLRSLRRASNYNRYLVDLVTPFLGDRVLDVGSGTGNLAGMLLARPRVVMIDRDAHRVRRLRSRFAGRSNTRIEQADITDRDWTQSMSDEPIDTVLAVNCLQQIGPDFLAVRNAFKLLQPGGHFVAIVPIGMHRMNSVDLGLGHERRYEPDQLCGMVEHAGFEIVESLTFNRVGSIAWTMNGLTGCRRIGSAQITAFDRMWPMLRRLDRFWPASPLSALVVGRK